MIRFFCKLFALSIISSGICLLAADPNDTSFSNKTARQIPYFFNPSSHRWQHSLMSAYATQQESTYHLVRLRMRKPPVVGHGYAGDNNSRLAADNVPKARLGFGALFNGNNFLSKPQPNLPVVLNPNFSGLFASGTDSCKAASGELGICIPSVACAGYGGRPSGSCTLVGTVCCVNSINKCNNQATLNNTYWETVNGVITRPSTCDLIVRFDKRLVEQKQPICQIRLDFVSMNIGGPDTSTSLCSLDSFQVTGASSGAPKICGENIDNHMYLNVPNSGTTPTSVTLSFNFATGEKTTPSWKIRIALLPCGADYLAPSHCLQYFRTVTGTVKSFNWKNEATARQLGNQDYNICFRNELIDGTRTTQLCLSVCETTDSFSLSGADGTANGNTALTSCNADFLVFANSFSKATPANIADRYCGGKFNPTDGSTASVTVCSKRRDFQLSYVTDGAEASQVNVGFCLKFQQSAE